MDLVASMLAAELQKNHKSSIELRKIALPIRRVFSSVPWSGSFGFSADRFVHRLAEYPAWLALHRGEFDLFHIVDHSYSQLAHYLPQNRTIVTCHDLDTFASILNPPRETRSGLFRAMSRHILRGLQRAARVVCDSSSTKQELLQQDLIPEQRTTVVPLGAHTSCSPAPNNRADGRAAELLPDPRSIYILHVGSTIPRKRIDVLLKIVSRLHAVLPQIRLVRVGGAFTEAQKSLLNELSLSDYTDVLPYLDRDTLAAVYRRADIVLVTSEAEGFGLPVLEAMACGTPVVASDIAVLREIGGSGVLAYCRVADIEAWCSTLIPILQEHQTDSGWRRRVGAASLAHVAQFSWARYASQMVDIYQSVFAQSMTGTEERSGLNDL